MFKRFKLKRGEVIRTVLICIAVVLLLPSAALAEATGVMSYVDDAGIPPAGSVVFISYYNNSDVKIQTEDSFNDLNNNSGYGAAQGTCVAQPGSFSGDQTGQAYNIHVSRPGASKWGRGAVTALPASGVSYTTPGTSSSKIALSTTSYVGLPQSVVAYKGKGVIALRWSTPATGTPTGYRVYRRPSATEVATRIAFDRRGTPTTGFIADTGTNGTTMAYIICAYNATGYGPHTDEIVVTPDASVVTDISSLSPPSGMVGSTFTVNGSGLGSAGYVFVNGKQATTSNWTPTSITVTVPVGATTGSVYVINTENNTVSDSSTFTVTSAPVPSISISPNGVSTKYYPGDTVNATITGLNTNFVSGTTVSIADGLQVSNRSVNVGAQTISLTITIPAGTAAGAKTVSVNSDSCTTSFTVSAITLIPTFESINPAQGELGATNLEVTIVGQNTHFTDASSVSFGDSNITVSNIHGNGTSLTCNINIAASATVGSKDVVVTSGGGTETVTGTAAFSVMLHPVGEITKAYPNPFNPLNKNVPLSIVFSTATGEAVDIYIFDTNGRIIWQKRNTDITPSRTVVWDGETAYGETVENGIYMIRVVKSGKPVGKYKVMVIKK